MHVQHQSCHGTGRVRALETGNVTPGAAERTALLIRRDLIHDGVNKVTVDTPNAAARQLTKPARLDGENLLQRLQAICTKGRFEQQFCHM
jgi:hypothetical protein